MCIKTTIKHVAHPLKCLKLKRLAISSVWEDNESWYPQTELFGTKMVQEYENSLAYNLKLKHTLTHDLIIPLSVFI